jgi:hypothetical protein
MGHDIRAIGVASTPTKRVELHFDCRKSYAIAKDGDDYTCSFHAFIMELEEPFNLHLESSGDFESYREVWTAKNQEESSWTWLDDNTWEGGEWGNEQSDLDDPIVPEWYVEYPAIGEKLTVRLWNKNINVGNNDIDFYGFSSEEIENLLSVMSDCFECRASFNGVTHGGFLSGHKFMDIFSDAEPEDYFKGGKTIVIDGITYVKSDY